MTWQQVVEAFERLSTSEKDVENILQNRGDVVARLIHAQNG